MSQQQPPQQQQHQQPHQQPLPPSQQQARPSPTQHPSFASIQQSYAYPSATHPNFQRPSFNQQSYYVAPYPHQIPYNQFAPIYPQPPNVSFNSPIPPPSTGQQVASTHQRLKPREKTVATIRDPETKQEIDLKSSLSTKNSTTTTGPTTNTNNSVTNANKNPTVSTKNSNENSSSPSVSNIFLQKVSEGLIDSKKDQVASDNKEAKSDVAKEPIAQANKVKQPTELEPKAAAEEPKTVVKQVPKSDPKPKPELKPEPEPTTKVETKEVTAIDEAPLTNSNNGSKSETINAEPITKKQDDSAPTNEASVPEKASEDVIEENEANATANVDSEDKKEGESNGNALHYEPGQYNPISNRSGRKVYSKQFLLDICEKVCKLKDFFIVLDDPQNLDDKNDPFAPSFAQIPRGRQNNTTIGRQSQPNYMGRNSAGQEGRQRKVIPPSSSLTQEVELKTVANPWRPSKEVKEDTPNDVAEAETLKKKFRSILNKLTPNNFDNLSASVTSLGIDTEAKLSDVIDIIFAKALTEPGYCVLYGQMCSHLKNTSGPHFGKTLLSRCQNQFLSDIYASLNLEERQKKIEEEQDAEVKKQLQDELYEDMYRCRMRGLGLIKFIGELYKIHMLNDAIMFECIVRLLHDTSEESLECLCDLLTTIGERLDESSQASAKEEKKSHKGPKANAYQGGQRSAAAVVASGAAQPKPRPESLTTLDPVFEQLHKIRKDKALPIPVRIRFKLLDVCELREKFNWQSKKTKDNNPKKLNEIREAHQEKLDAERRQNAMAPRRSQEGRRGLGHSGGSSNQISSMANESSGMRNATNMHASSSSHSIRDYPTGDNTKTNSHYEQLAHQRSLKNLPSLASLVPSANNNSSRELRPATLSRLTPSSSIGGSGGGLRPFSAPKIAAPVVPPTNSTATNAASGANTTNTTTNNA